MPKYQSEQEYKRSFLYGSYLSFPKGHPFRHFANGMFFSASNDPLNLFERRCRVKKKSYNKKSRSFGLAQEDGRCAI
ncbi:hypothetical protein AG1IA_06239 [Rhizoctonia solani AG-1 IA]|uniref:Uncharacterized protein n=1 Tax=Thanatephorus cucumeris (strain AG1-IA) TaxID=983506 RepID=L8WTR6_THACA|nr:hypothetical protein AG1IA_06239 [Rhizoctonia solani AG-1 IA]